MAGGDSAPEGYAPTEIGSDDEDVAMVESYAFAQRVMTNCSVELRKPQHQPSKRTLYCKICSVVKTTSACVAKKPDTKAGDLINAPTKPFEQLATDDVIIAKGDDHVGIGVGGVKTHHVVRDVFSGARVAYPMSKRCPATCAQLQALPRPEVRRSTSIMSQQDGRSRRADRGS